MVLCRQNGREAHQHRAGVVAQHGVVGAFQPPQTEQSKKRPADIVEKDHGAAVAFAGDLARPVDLHPAALFTPGAGIAVAAEPLALGIVGQTAQHIHGNAVSHKTFHHIVDAEGFGPVVLCDHQYSFLAHGATALVTEFAGAQPLRHTILLTTPV